MKFTIGQLTFDLDCNFMDVPPCTQIMLIYHNIALKYERIISLTEQVYTQNSTSEYP